MRFPKKKKSEFFRVWDPGTRAISETAEKKDLGREGQEELPIDHGCCQISRYDIVFAVNQLARAMLKPSKSHMGAAKHLLRYLAGFYSDANWGTNPENGKLTSSVVMHINGPISFKMGLQSLTVQSMIEVELVAAALTMNGAVFCPKMMVELCFEKMFSSIPLYLDTTSRLHVAGNRTYSPRVKHVVLGYFFVQELVEEGKFTIHYVSAQYQLADLGPKHLGKAGLCFLSVFALAFPVFSRVSRGKHILGMAWPRLGGD